MPDLPGAPALAERRDLLRLLLLAPAAAACASAAPATRPSGPAPSSGPPEDPSEGALRAIREHPLPPEAEPALVFRAAGRAGR